MLGAASELAIVKALWKYI